MNSILSTAKAEMLMLKRYPMNIFFNVVAALFSLIPLICTAAIFGLNDRYIWLISGGLIWAFISQALWTVGLSLRAEQERGTLEQILLTPVSLIQVMAGKSIFPMGLNILTLMLGLIILKLGFGINTSIVKVFIIVILSFPSIYGLALIVSVLVLKFKEVFALMQVLAVLMMILCGVSQPLSMLPESLQKIGHWIVFEKIVFVFRWIISENPAYDLLYNDFLFIGIYGLVLNIMAWLLFNRFRKNHLMKGDGLFV